MLSDLDLCYLQFAEPARGCLYALRDIILGVDSGVRSALKYGMPFFFVGTKRFCYLWVDKKTGHPYIGLTEGRYMHHPSLQAGDRSRMKILPVDPQADFPVEQIRSVLREAIRVSTAARA